MTRSEFGHGLQAHDWYYSYSDDYRVWTAGRQAAMRLQSQHAALDCPFSMSDLRKWAHNMVLELYAEEEPGCWYRQPRRWKTIAPVKRDDLITQAQHDEITQWLGL